MDERACTMLDPRWYGSDEDRDCGKEPVLFRCKRDPEHVICGDCYDAMASDPDIQAEYEPL